MIAATASPPATSTPVIVTPPLAGRRYGTRRRLPKDLGARLVVPPLLLLELALLALADLVGRGLVLWRFLVVVVDEDELLQPRDGVLSEDGFGRRFPAEELDGGLEGGG